MVNKGEERLGEIRPIYTTQSIGRNKAYIYNSVNIMSYMYMYITNSDLLKSLFAVPTMYPGGCGECCNMSTSSSSLSTVYIISSQQNSK